MVRALDLSQRNAAILHFVRIQDAVLTAIPSRTAVDVCGKQGVIWVYSSCWLLAVALRYTEGVLLVAPIIVAVVIGGVVGAPGALAADDLE